MENINKYIYSLIITSLVAILAELILPKADGDGAARYVDMISGLCIVIALLGPIRAGVTWLTEYQTNGISGVISSVELSEIDAYGQGFDIQLTAVTEEEILRCVCEKFAIKEQNIRLYASISKEYKLASVTVILSGEGILENPSNIIEYVRNTFGCECTVAVE